MQARDADRLAVHAAVDCRGRRQDEVDGAVCEQRAPSAARSRHDGRVHIEEAGRTNEAEVGGEELNDGLGRDEGERADHAVQDDRLVRLAARLDLVDRLHSVRVEREAHALLDRRRLLSKEDRPVRLAQAEEADELDERRELRAPGRERQQIDRLAEAAAARAEERVEEDEKGSERDARWWSR